MIDEFEVKMRRTVSAIYFFLDDVMCAIFSMARMRAELRAIWGNAPESEGKQNVI